MRVNARSVGQFRSLKEADRQWRWLLIRAGNVVGSDGKGCYVLKRLHKT